MSRDKLITMFHISSSDSSAYMQAYLVFADNRAPVNVTGKIANETETDDGVSSKDNESATLDY
ncbi:MAG: hypothetical protein LBF87_01860 [Treponema sp.]|jgi:hypothetical protein|nr:hypothetical protein [Treponema sp.]